MISIELALLILAILLLTSIFASKVSDRIGIPALLLFLAVGMLAGSDGIGGIYFDNAFMAQGIGVVALAIILFSGGLDTEWQSIQPVLPIGIVLAVLGVLITALLVGATAYFVLDVTWLEAMLLGSIVSSTDAAAVFAVLRSRSVSLKGRLRPLLELESGSNDPMAIFLTISMIQFINNPELSLVQIIPMFFKQMGIGALAGYAMGRLSLRLINAVKLGYDGLYPVLTLSLALLTYGLTAFLGGSGFLAVYIAGLTLRKGEFIHRRSLLSFFDGMAWLMQIAMFLTLGLLVFPSQLPSVVLPGLIIAAVLMFVARPISVFLSTIFFRMRLAEKTLVAWVGLRGAAPIVLATFPLLAGISQADMLFNMVFFVVLTSVLVQGPSIPIVARWLGVDAPLITKRGYPIEANPEGGFRRRLRELFIPPESAMVGKRIVQLGLPAEFLVILIDRDNDFIIPSGGTEIQAGDNLLVISDDEAFTQVQKQAAVVTNQPAR